MNGVKKLDEKTFSANKNDKRKSKNDPNVRANYICKRCLRLHQSKQEGMFVKVGPTDRSERRNVCSGASNIIGNSVTFIPLSNMRKCCCCSDYINAPGESDYTAPRGHMSHCYASASALNQDCMENVKRLILVCENSKSIFRIRGAYPLKAAIPFDQLENVQIMERNRMLPASMRINPIVRETSSRSYCDVGVKNRYSGGGRQENENRRKCCCQKCRKREQKSHLPCCPKNPRNQNTKRRVECDDQYDDQDDVQMCQCLVHGNMGTSQRQMCDEQQMPFGGCATSRFAANAPSQPGKPFGNGGCGFDMQPRSCGQYPGPSPGIQMMTSQYPSAYQNSQARGCKHMPEMNCAQQDDCQQKINAPSSEQPQRNLNAQTNSAFCICHSNRNQCKQQQQQQGQDQMATMSRCQIGNVSSGNNQFSCGGNFTENTSQFQSYQCPSALAFGQPQPNGPRQQENTCQCRKQQQQQRPEEDQMANMRRCSTGNVQSGYNQCSCGANNMQNGNPQSCRSPSPPCNTDNLALEKRQCPNASALGQSQPNGPRQQENICQCRKQQQQQQQDDQMANMKRCPTGNVQSAINQDACRPNNNARLGQMQRCPSDTDYLSMEKRQCPTVQMAMVCQCEEKKKEQARDGILNELIDRVRRIEARKPCCEVSDDDNSDTDYLSLKKRECPDPSSNRDENEKNKGNGESEGTEQDSVKSKEL